MRSYTLSVIKRMPLKVEIEVFDEDYYNKVELPDPLSNLNPSTVTKLLKDKSIRDDFSHLFG